MKEIRNMNLKPVLMAISILLVFVLSACSSTEGLPDTGATLNYDEIAPAAQAAIDDLSNRLGVDVSEVEILSVEPVQWTDACLNLPQEGEECAQAITDGFLVTARVNGQEYELHTDLTGANIRQK